MNVDGSVIFILLLTAGLSFVITYVMVPVSMKLAVRFNAIDKPGNRHIHRRSTPRMGGVALFFGVTLSIFIVLLSISGFGSKALPDYLMEYNAPTLALGLSTIFLIGCFDDILRLNVLQKLAGQILSAVIIVASGVIIKDIHSATVGVYLSFGVWAYPITVLYLVAFTNVINLIDGLDGLAAGVSMIVSIAYLILSWHACMWGTATMAIAVITACLAFLRYNFHPACVFMGDCGSLFLGMTLGTISLMGTMRISSITSLAVPVIIAAVPVMDTFAAIVRRIRKHVSIGSADAGHMHHSLLELGFSQRSVVLTMYLVCAVFAASGVAISGSRLIVRLAIVAIDLLLAFVLVERLNLFDKVLVRHYPNGRARYLHGKAYATSESVGDEKLSIMIICKDFLSSCSAEAVRMGCAFDALVSAGNDAYVFTKATGDCGNLTALLNKNIHYYSCALPKNKSVVRQLFEMRSLIVGFTRKATSLGEFDIVICTSSSPVLLFSAMRIARKTHAHLVLDVCEIEGDTKVTGLFNREGFVQLVSSWIKQAVYQRAWLITASSPRIVKALKKTVGPEKEKRICLITCAADFVSLISDNELYNAESRSEAGASDGFDYS